MVALVEAMLDLHRKLAAAVTDQEKAVFRRQIVATDRHAEGDRLVYELYGLTEEEIGIVGSGRIGARSEDPKGFRDLWGLRGFRLTEPVRWCMRQGASG